MTTALGMEIWTGGESLDLKGQESTSIKLLTEKELIGLLQSRLKKSEVEILQLLEAYKRLVKS
jgi:hypothetical protein